MSFNPLQVKVVYSEGKKKRKVGEAERSWDTKGTNNDDADPASPSQSQPSITNSHLEADLDAIRRFIENAPTRTSTPPPSA